MMLKQMPSFFIFTEEIYQSIESYEARAEDELSFDVGVMLKVVEKTLDGWWLVRYSIGSVLHKPFWLKLGKLVDKVQGSSRIKYLTKLLPQSIFKACLLDKCRDRFSSV